MKTRFLSLLLLLSVSLSASAVSLSLDSIATWGKFPRFVVDTYRWGCDFFNGYDTTYVKGTGHPFNVKLKTESWTDIYNMQFENRTQMNMVSDLSTSAGLYLTYYAVSVGYDINIGKYFNGSDNVSKRFNFQFSCMLFSADLYFVSNDIGTRIKSIKPLDGELIRPNIPFDGVNNKEWGLNLQYYINHKRYSAAAAFNMSRVQIKSGGSFFAGFSFNRNQYNFDFSELPPDLMEYLPPNMPNNHYRVDNYNYLLRLGYGYNWVFHPKFTLGISEAPMIGVTRSYINEPSSWKTTVGAQSITQLSLVFNSGRWFAGLVGTAQVGLSRDSERLLVSSYLTLMTSVGWRFSLW